MLKRTAEDHLQNWYTGKRRKPLVLRGARQVGKSTLVRHFSETRRLQLSEVNLEQHLYLDDVFKTLEIETITREIEALTGKNLQHPDTSIEDLLAINKQLPEDTPLAQKVNQLKKNLVTIEQTSA